MAHAGSGTTPGGPKLNLVVNKCFYFGAMELLQTPLSRDLEGPCGGPGPAYLLITPFYGTCGDVGLAQETSSAGLRPHMVGLSPESGWPPGSSVAMGLDPSGVGTHI
jgi:hypothetical protein